MKIRIDQEDKGYFVELDGDKFEIVHGLECAVSEFYLRAIDHEKMTLEAFLNDFNFNVKQWVEGWEGKGT